MAEVSRKSKRHWKDASSHLRVVQLLNRLFQSSEGGALERKRINPTEFKQTIRTNYQMMGWNDRGVPLEAMLAELKFDQLECQNIFRFCSNS